MTLRLGSFVAQLEYITHTDSRLNRDCFCKIGALLRICLINKSINFERNMDLRTHIALAEASIDLKQSFRPSNPLEGQTSPFWYPLVAL